MASRGRRRHTSSEGSGRNSNAKSLAISGSVPSGEAEAFAKGHARHEGHARDEGHAGNEGAAAREGGGSGKDGAN